MSDFYDQLRVQKSSLAMRLEAATNEFHRKVNELQEAFQQDTAMVREELEAVANLLKIHERRQGPLLATAPDRGEPQQPITDFIVRLLRERGALSKEDIRDEANKAGYFTSDENPGRATHMTVVNMIRSGRIADGGDGLYRLPLVTQFADLADVVAKSLNIAR